MRRFLFPCHFIAAIAIFITASLSETLAVAQEQETVKIDTVDGVRLHANYYASAKKNAPTVILLHPIGEGKSSKAAEWRELAEALQKANYSVLMFDFRGHGESTNIQDDKVFWAKPINQNFVKSKNKGSIDVKDFIKQGDKYLPVLVNDIAAVRAYLDRRNDDAKDCNTSSLIVIGAEGGASLGAIWINAEWHRYRYAPPANFFGPLNAKFIDRSPEGKDIIGAVFLSVQPTLEKRQVSVSSLLKTACKDNYTAAFFICGKEDTKAASYARTLEKALKGKDKKHGFIFASELETNLSGVKLLQKSLGTTRGIISELDKVVDERKNDRVDREFRDTYYVWRTGTGVFSAKNKKGEKNLNFEEYNKFAQ